MSVTGIIAEFNPLHNGHKYLINKAKEDGDKIVIILSSDFVQRGDCAIFSKEVRTTAALLCGADLVIELPTIWSMAGAEKFAMGAVSILKNTSIINKLCFGIQNDDLKLLKEISIFLNSTEYKQEIKQSLSTNKTFAGIREEILKNKFNINEDILKDGNNILAIEYIRACLNLDFNPIFKPIERIGTSHDSLNTVNEFSSASYIRQHIKDKSFNYITKYIPNELVNLYSTSPIADISLIHNSILFKLRSMSEDDYKQLPDLSEGLENRLYKAVQSSKSFQELLENLKTKRYTLSRIRRLVINAALGIKDNNSCFLPPYIRVLGFNKNGEDLVRQISKNSTLPLVINSKQTNTLKGIAKSVFDLQSNATDLYGLSLSSPLPCGTDYKFKTVKLDI